MKQEFEFKRKLAEQLAKPPYSHRVYSHENPNEFSIHGAKGYVDLYVETNPDWPHHDDFPVLGIETKVARSMGWLIEAIEQVHKYNTDLRNAIYTIKGKRVPAPNIFLVATPESWGEGYLYKWMPPELQAFSSDMEDKVTKAARWGAWHSLTFLYERLLMKHGASILRPGMFFTNMHGNNGAITGYRLEVIV